jgi:hypothetical protein
MILNICNIQDEFSFFYRLNYFYMQKLKIIYGLITCLRDKNHDHFDSFIFGYLKKIKIKIYFWLSYPTSIILNYWFIIWLGRRSLYCPLSFFVFFFYLYYSIIILNYRLGHQLFFYKIK